MASLEIDKMEYSTDSSAQTAYVTNHAAYPAASGGTITTSGSDTIHTFSSNGTFTPANTGTVSVQCWGGGGGGGTVANSAGGGGGGGAYAATSNVSVTTATGYAVVVGTAGTANNAADLSMLMLVILMLVLWSVLPFLLLALPHLLILSAAHPVTY